MCTQFKMGELASTGVFVKLQHRLTWQLNFCDEGETDTIYDLMQMPSATPYAFTLR